MALAHYSPPALIRAIVQGTSLTTVVRLPPQDWLQDRTCLVDCQPIPNTNFGIVVYSCNKPKTSPA